MERVYFYYPTYGHTYRYKLPSSKEEKDGVYPRTVLAGVVRDNKIFVGEAKCFTGNKTVSPDQFNKKRGRTIAEARANGGKVVMTIDIPEGTVAVGKLFVSKVEEVYPKHVRAEVSPKA